MCGYDIGVSAYTPAGYISSNQTCAAPPRLVLYSMPFLGRSFSRRKAMATRPICMHFRVIELLL